MLYSDNNALSHHHKAQGEPVLPLVPFQKQKVHVSPACHRIQIVPLDSLCSDAYEETVEEKTISQNMLSKLTVRFHQIMEAWHSATK